MDNLDNMTRDQLREIARENGVPLRLNKTDMIARLRDIEAGDIGAAVHYVIPDVSKLEAELRSNRTPFDREARDALRRTPETAYDPAGHLTGRLATSKRAQSRFNRRHTVISGKDASKHPMRPNIRVLTPPLRTRIEDDEGSRRVRVDSRFLPGIMGQRVRSTPPLVALYPPAPGQSFFRSLA